MAGVQLLIPIREPELIAVIDEARKGNVSLTDLRRKIGRRKADKGISQAKALMLQLSLAVKEYIDNPVRCEVEFIKECFGIHNGVERKHFTLDGTTTIKRLPDNSMLLITKGENR